MSWSNEMDRRNLYASEEDVREKRKNKYKRIRSKAREQYLQTCGYSMKSKPPLPSHLIAPTQSITNGDKTDNSDESGSIRGGYSSSRERSRSREGSRERERRDRPQNPQRPESDYGIVQTQPRSSKGKRPIPRRHTVGGSALAIEAETERSKEAFMDMLASRYPQYAEKISSTASEDGFPVRVSQLYIF